jgi:hypothetical protein
MTYPGYPPGRSPPAQEGRAAAPWITLHRSKAPLISVEILSKQTGPALNGIFTTMNGERPQYDEYDYIS